MFKAENKTLIKFLIIFFFWLLILTAVIIFSRHHVFNLLSAYAWETGSYWWQSLSGWYGYFIRWDSGWYVKIALAGYTESTLVFLPLYPLLIRGVNFFLHHVYLSGLLVAWGSFLIYLIYLFKLVKHFFSGNSYFKILLLILSFPVSFFLVSLYAEATFLALAVAAFYYFEKKQFWPLVLCLSLAALTKVYGLFLPLLFFADSLFLKKEIKKAFLLLISYLPVLGYFIYLFKIGFNPLAIFVNQQSWGRSLYLSNYWQTGLNYLHSLKDLFFSPSMFAFAETTDLLFFLFFVLLVIVSYKKIPKIYSWYAILILALPLLSGTLISIKRYVLLIFPIFIYLAQILKGRAYFIYLAFSLLFLIFCFWLFVNSAWVA